MHIYIYHVYLIYIYIYTSYPHSKAYITGGIKAVARMIQTLGKHIRRTHSKDQHSMGLGLASPDRTLRVSCKLSSLRSPPSTEGHNTHNHTQTHTRHTDTRAAHNTHTDHARSQRDRHRRAGGRQTGKQTGTRTDSIRQFGKLSARLEIKRPLRSRGLQEEGKWRHALQLLEDLLLALWADWMGIHQEDMRNITILAML